MMVRDAAGWSPTDLRGRRSTIVNFSPRAAAGELRLASMGECHSQLGEAPRLVVVRAQDWFGASPWSMHMMLPALSVNQAARPMPGMDAISPSHSIPGMSKT